MASADWTRIRIVTTEHEGIAMNRPIAADWKAVITSTAVPHRRLADKIRFAGGIAITVGGSAVLLSDLIALIPSFG